MLIVIKKARLVNTPTIIVYTLKLIMYTFFIIVYTPYLEIQAMVKDQVIVQDLESLKYFFIAKN